MLRKTGSFSILLASLIFANVAHMLRMLFATRHLSVVFMD